jgi:hypothetical protein
MLTPLQQQRQKYLERKRATNRSDRQQETLNRLAKFRTSLQAAKSQAHNESEGGDSTKKETQTYHGQVLEGDEYDDGEDNTDTSWMAAKLKFKKHIDDQFRNFDPAADVRSL